MRHPEVILVPLLLLADYFLTLIGAKAASGKYGQHFRTAHYELNPVWQQAVAQRKWFNPRQLSLVAVISAGFYYLTFALSDDWFAGLVGLYFGIFGSVIGRHISNLLTFRYFENHPDEVQGEVRLAHSLTLALSQVQFSLVLIPLLLLSLTTGEPTVLGAACGVGMLIALHAIWLSKSRRAIRSPHRDTTFESPRPRICPRCGTDLSAALDAFCPECRQSLHD